MTFKDFAVYYPKSCFFVFCLFVLFSQVEVVIVTNLPRGIVVVILTGTATAIHAVIPEVAVEVARDIQVFQVEAAVLLGEVEVICPVLTSRRLTPTEVKTPVVEGVSHNRMGPGTIWDHSSTM